MICALVEPSEAAAVMLGYSSWIILDFLVEQLVGNTKMSKVIASIFIILGIAVVPTASMHGHSIEIEIDGIGTGSASGK